MTMFTRKIMPGGFVAAIAAMFMAWAPQTSAQEMTPELDAWLKANALGSYADGTENWDEIVAKAKEEGEVIVYTSSGRIAKLVDDFAAHYPGITLTVFYLCSDKTV